MKKYLHKKNLREYFFFSLDYVRIIAHGEGVSVFRTGRKHYSTVGAFQPIGSALRPNKRRFRRYTIFEFPVKCNLPAGFFFFFFFFCFCPFGGKGTIPSRCRSPFHRFYAARRPVKRAAKGFETCFARAHALFCGPPKIINEVSREQAARFSYETILEKMTQD